MEYDRSRTRWTHIAAYLLYAAGVIYLLMSNNPFLYSHRELRLALAGEHVDTVSPIPKGPNTEANKGDVVSWLDSSPERTGHDLSGQTRDKDYVTEWSKPLLMEAESESVTDWSADESGLVVTGKSPWAMAFTPEGDLRWRFRFSETTTDPGLLAPLADQQAIYITRPSGQMAALNKLDGKLQWKLNFASLIVAPPLLIEEDLWVLIRPLESEEKRLEDIANQERPSSSSKSKAAAPSAAQYRFVRINRNSGELVAYSGPLTVSGPTYLTWAREAKQILITNDNKLMSVNVEDPKAVSSQTLPDPIKGPAVVAEGKIFLSLASGKIQAWDLSKKGKFEWEVDLDSPPQGSPTYIPLYQRLSVATTDGHLHMIDIKKAERLWKFQPENRNLNHQVWATRLSGRFIEKMGMTWEKKGWSFWTACSDNRLCIYNPDKGQLLARVSAPGAVLSLPLFVGKEFYLLTSERKGEKRNFSIHRYMEEDLYKQKMAAAKNASQDPAANK